MVDIFQFSNVYALTPEIHRLYADNALQIECVQYVAKKDTLGEPFAKVFSLYCSLSNGVTVSAFYQTHKVDHLQIDIRRFITFGLVKSFVRRIHKYPIKVPQPYFSGADVGLSKQLKRCGVKFFFFLRLCPHTLLPLRLLTGTHHYDEICTTLNHSSEEIDDVLSQDPNVKPVWS